MASMKRRISLTKKVGNLNVKVSKLEREAKFTFNRMMYCMGEKFHGQNKDIRRYGISLSNSLRGEEGRGFLYD